MIKQEFICETVCYVMQGFDKNLSPQSAYAFRAFGNSFMVYMVLWEQVLTPIYAIKKWEAGASLENHKRKKQRKTQTGGSRHPNFELGILSFDLFSASPPIMNYSVLNWKISSYNS